jgi:hypothetical protein
VGCDDTWDVSCVHSRFCLRHAREHGRAEGACDKAIDFALAVVITDGLRPFYVALESTLDVDTGKIEREIFPANSQWLEILRSLWEIHRQVLTVINPKLNQFTAVLRERFEGDAMPFGLTDDEVWDWYKAHVTGEDAEH